MRKFATEIEVTKFTEQEIFHHVSELSVQLGGMRLAHYRSGSGDKTYFPAGSRQGLTQQHPNWKPAMFYAPYDCFGEKLVPYARPKAIYQTLHHYTITTCKATCWKKNIVVCVRELAKSGRKVLSIHIAGDCPYTHYKE